MREHSEDTKTTLGFWIYLMTDCVLFATLFATYAVLRNNVAGGPGASDLFELPFVFGETMILLTSSFTCGLALLYARRNQKQLSLLGLMLTALLGVTFLGMEMYEFAHLVQDGHSWTRSGFLSAFFTLVGTHGAHIGIGLLWAFVLLWRITKEGLSHPAMRQLTLFGMFWHFLDIVWIFIFSFVYLLGVA